jgi:hypothetical protein
MPRTLSALLATAALCSCATAPPPEAAAARPYDACYDAAVVARVAKVTPVFVASGSKHTDALSRAEPALLLEVRRVVEGVAGGPWVGGLLEARGELGVTYRPGDQSTFWLRAYEPATWEVTAQSTTPPGPKCAGFSRPG